MLVTAVAGSPSLANADSGESGPLKKHALPERHFRSINHKNSLGLPGVHHAKNMAIRHYLKTGKANVIDQDGYLLLPYGHALPVIHCATYHICDIALQKGEQIRSIAVGDDNWVYKPTASGDGPEERPHVIIEPRTAGSSTSIVVMTTRRTYSMLLTANSKKFYPRVAFWYPDDWVSHFEVRDTQNDDSSLSPGTPALRARHASDDSEKNTKTLYVAHPENLHFDYKIFGDHPSWAPTNVYDDGLNTYIKFPDSIEATFHPGIFLMDRRGEGADINYNMDGNTAIIHQLTRKILVKYDVGGDSEKVIIERKSRKKKGFFSW